MKPFTTKMAKLGTVNGDKKTLVIVCAEDWYVVSHRLALARAAKAAGHPVHIVCRVGLHRSLLEAEGFTVSHCPFRRGSLNPFSEIKLISMLAEILQQQANARVMLISIRMAWTGGLAAWLAGHHQVVFLITGFGWLLSSESLTGRLLRWMMIRPLVALLKRGKVIVQNADDLAWCRNRTIQNVNLIPGSGVNTELFEPVNRDHNTQLVVTFCARLLVEKGIHEFCQAAQVLVAKHGHVSFVVAGNADHGNPGSVSVEELRSKYADEPSRLVFVGHQKNVDELLQGTDVFVLPSYREGMPLALLEAAACECALVGTDVPGIRDFIEQEVTGLLVAPKRADLLVQAIERLIEDRELRCRLAKDARLKVLQGYTTAQINEQTLEMVW
jgi:glycosyltransferase involved in cell wall biosynthesis